MTITEVIKHFGDIAGTAAKLGITYQAVQQWVKRDRIPSGRQYQIQLITKGRLKAAGKTSNKPAQDAA